jgi:hypothetical protein
MASLPAVCRSHSHPSAIPAGVFEKARPHAEHEVTEAFSGIVEKGGDVRGYQKFTLEVYAECVMQLFHMGCHLLWCTATPSSTSAWIGGRAGHTYIHGDAGISVLSRPWYVLQCAVISASHITQHAPANALIPRPAYTRHVGTV